MAGIMTEREVRGDLPAADDATGGALSATGGGGAGGAGGAAWPAGGPGREAFAGLLDAHAPFMPAPLCPQVRVFHARTLMAVWEAAELLAGQPLPAPFWAYPWAAGSALARVILDRPERVRGRRVLDVGAGGGVATLAAAVAGAAEAVANDQDPWALATALLAAERQGLAIGTLQGDATRAPETTDAFDVVLCGDLAYERRVAPRVRALLVRAAARGAEVLVADAGRTYFEESGYEVVERFTVAVPWDLEGVVERVATVYRL
jgi:predicted nicotinamide N-methyase